MTKIVASAGQRTCRDLFKKAVAYAKAVIAAAVLKKEWQKKLGRRNGVYNEAVKTFMLGKIIKQSVLCSAAKSRPVHDIEAAHKKILPMYSAKKMDDSCLKSIEQANLVQLLSTA